MQAATKMTSYYIGGGGDGVGGGGGSGCRVW